MTATNKKIAVFPGSFDPFTKGHEEIVLRASYLFDEIIIALGNNSQKQTLFPLEKRIEFIQQTFAGNQQIKVETYNGLTVDFCQQKNAKTILRGLRSVSDMEFERPIAQMNRSLNASIETIFLMSSPQYAAISSTIVRDIHKHGGNITPYLPAAVKL